MGLDSTRTPTPPMWRRSITSTSTTCRRWRATTTKTHPGWRKSIKTDFCPFGDFFFRFLFLGLIYLPFLCSRKGMCDRDRSSLIHYSKLIYHLLILIYH